MFSFHRQANSWRYRQGRDLADKANRRRIRRWGCFLESTGAARACPVHTMLGATAFIFILTKNFPNNPQLVLLS